MASLQVRLDHIAALDYPSHMSRFTKEELREIRFSLWAARVLSGAMEPEAYQVLLRDSPEPVPVWARPPGDGQK